jgi:HAD superfamily hydrolase (TIGR01484 family)
MPIDFSKLSKEKRNRVAHLYFDVDDTLTTKGLLKPEAVAALYQAADAGLSLVAVTGRSAAWAEMLFRIFPLKAVIGETGALYFANRNGQLSVVHHEKDSQVRSQHKERRDKAAQAVLSEIPGARLASDNMGRLYDVAFDLVEDGPPVPAAIAAQIRSRLEDDGLNVMQSSVHINAFFGSFNKATMVRQYLQNEENTNLEAIAETIVYVGDSANDGSLFEILPLSVGVANIEPHLPALEALGQAPAYRVNLNGGSGFARVVELILEAK